MSQQHFYKTAIEVLLSGVVINLDLITYNFDPKAVIITCRSRTVQFISSSWDCIVVSAKLWLLIITPRAKALIDPAAIQTLLILNYKVSINAWIYKLKTYKSWNSSNDFWGVKTLSKRMIWKKKKKKKKVKHDKTNLE